MAPVEKRIDSDDGEAYTWEELSAYYKGKYKKHEIASYWDGMTAAKAKGEAKGKAKAKAEPKAAPKAKAKAKAKVKEGSSLAKQKVKLHYWPARGRGEQVRLALAATNVDFEDVTFDMSDKTSQEEFMAKCRELGGNATSNTPMLEVKGKFYTQSTAIVKFVCALGGLGTDRFGVTYQVDNIIEHVEDLRRQAYKPLVLFGGGEKEKEVFLGLLPKHLGNLERLLGDRKYFAGGKLSAADICVYDVLDTMVETQVPGTLAASHPKLTAFRERMSKLSGIEKYHDTEQHKKLWAFPAL